MITYIGNSAGANMKRAAQNYAIIGFATGIGFIVFEVVTLGLLYKWLALMLMGGHEEYAAILEDLFRLYLFILPFDSLTVIYNGVVKPMLKGKQALILLGFIYYICGIPLQWYLTFTLGLQTKGIWLGCFFDWLVIDICFMILLWKMDWDAQLRKILAKLKIE